MGSYGIIIKVIVCFAIFLFGVFELGHFVGLLMYKDSISWTSFNLVTLVWIVAVSWAIFELFKIIKRIKIVDTPT